MNNNGRRVVSVFHIGKIFGDAYLKAAVLANIIKGFEKCGIWPFHFDVFSDLDFVAINTTEQEQGNKSLVSCPSRCTGYLLLWLHEKTRHILHHK